MNGEQTSLPSAEPSPCWTIRYHKVSGALLLSHRDQLNLNNRTMDGEVYRSVTRVTHFLNNTFNHM